MKSFPAGLFELTRLEASDLAPVADILHHYRNLNLQVADGVLLNLASREKIHTVFTLDRRDFGAVRLKTGKKLEVIPSIYK